MRHAVCRGEHKNLLGLFMGGLNLQIGVLMEGLQMQFCKWRASSLYSQTAVAPSRKWQRLALASAKRTSLLFLD
jgi:hypothetical protein